MATFSIQGEAHLALWSLMSAASLDSVESGEQVINIPGTSASDFLTDCGVITCTETNRTGTRLIKTRTKRQTCLLCRHLATDKGSKC